MEVCFSKSKKLLMGVLIVLLGIFPLLFVTSCQPVSKEWVINNLFPNLWVFISHIISAVVLILVMTWLLWKPAKNALQKRHDYIASQIEQAQKANQEAQLQFEQANKAKVDALGQAMVITTKAKAEAFNIVEQAKVEAKQESNRIIDSAKADIEREKQQVKANAQDSVIDIAFDVASSILEKEIKVSDKEKYIDEMLSEISKDIEKSE